METEGTLAFYCEEQVPVGSKEDGYEDVMILFSGNNRGWFGESHLPLIPEDRSRGANPNQRSLNDCYLMWASDLEAFNKRWPGSYCFDFASCKMVLRASPKDFPSIVGLYLHPVTSGIEMDF